MPFTLHMKASYQNGFSYRFQDYAKLPEVTAQRNRVCSSTSMAFFSLSLSGKSSLGCSMEAPNCNLS